MESGTSCAVPADLIAYSRAAAEIDEQIHQLAVRLGRVLDAYRATHPEFGRPIPRIEDDLERHARRCQEIDRRVALVAAAFERAGAGAGDDTRGPAEPVVVDESAVSAALAELGKEAGRTEGAPSALDSAIATAGSVASAALHGVESAAGGLLHALESPFARAEPSDHAEQGFLSGFAAGAHELIDAANRLAAGISENMLSGSAVPAPSPGLDPKVVDALDQFHRHLDEGGFLGGDRGDLEAIDRVLQGLSPEEVNQFVASLSTHDLQEWNRRISDSGGVLFHQDGLSDDDRGNLANTLLRWVDPDQLARVRQYMSGLEPSSSAGKVHPTGWRSAADLPLFDPGTLGPSPETDINQGLDGDCWFLSAVAAIAEWHPDVIARNLHENANGTYTVTFYRDGHPTNVTVTDDYPTDKDGLSYAHTYKDGGKWAMIYEKAYAQFKGGYGSIDGGYDKVSLADLTGSDASTQSTGDQSLADIADKIGKGYAVTCGSQRQWPWDGPNEHGPSGDIVRQHVYYVRSVDTKGQPPTITLVNPWGIDGGAPQVVVLTQKQWHDYFDDVSSAKVGA